MVLYLYSCEQHYTPKPRGFFRIDLPEKAYNKYDSLSVYSFEYPQYAAITPDYNAMHEKNWVNIEFVTLKASLHLTYKKLNNNVALFADESRTMAFKHLPMANAITDSVFAIEGKSIFGTMYQISGRGVASPIQFFLTDSSRHFVRGALYFNFRPNNDSIMPLIQFVKADIIHFIQSLNWKP